MALLYTKFQLNRTKTEGGVIRKRKSLRTDGRTDAKGYNIIRPFSTGRIIKNNDNNNNNNKKKKKREERKGMENPKLIYSLFKP